MSLPGTFEGATSDEESHPQPVVSKRVEIRGNDAGTPQPSSVVAPSPDESPAMKPKKTPNHKCTTAWCYPVCIFAKGAK